MNRPLCNILIVDDEVSVLTSLRRMLHGGPYRLYTANSAPEALHLMEAVELSVIIADFRMPEMDGVTFLQHAKAQQPESVRMILSGFADISTIVDAINKGEIFKFAAKPWNDEELKLTISQSIEQWHVVQDNKRLATQLLDQNKKLEELNVALEQEVRRRSRDLMLKDRRLVLTLYIIERMPVGLVGIDENEVIVLGNRKASTILSVRDGGLIGKRRDVVFSGELGKEVGRLLHSNVETHWIKAAINGRYYWLYRVPLDVSAAKGNNLLVILDDDRNGNGVV